MRRAGAEAGMTLVELLVVVAISGLIMPVLAGAFVVGWRTTDATVTSLSDSRNRQIGPSLFTRVIRGSETYCRKVARPRFRLSKRHDSPRSPAANWPRFSVSAGRTCYRFKFCRMMGPEKRLRFLSQRSDCWRTS